MSSSSSESDDEFEDAEEGVQRAVKKYLGEQIREEHIRVNWVEPFNSFAIELEMPTAAACIFLQLGLEAQLNLRTKAVVCDGMQMFVKQKCQPVLKKLQEHNFAWIFNQPVDPVELGLAVRFCVERASVLRALSG